MGTLTSALTSIATGVVTSRARNYVSDSIDNAMRRRELRAQQDLALQNLQEKQANELQTATKETTLDKEKIALDQQKADRERKKALKRAVSRQNALAGARGVSDSASGEAILLGLFDESEEERKERDRLDTLRNKSLEQGIENRQRRNLLEVSQLRERQALERSLL